MKQFLILIALIPTILFAQTPEQRHDMKMYMALDYLFSLQQAHSFDKCFYAGPLNEENIIYNFANPEDLDKLHQLHKSLSYVTSLPSWKSFHKQDPHPISKEFIRPIRLVIKHRIEISYNGATFDLDHAPEEAWGGVWYYYPSDDAELPIEVSALKDLDPTILIGEFYAFQLVNAFK